LGIERFSLGLQLFLTGAPVVRPAPILLSVEEDKNYDENCCDFRQPNQCLAKKTPHCEPSMGLRELVANTFAWLFIG
jgi:hypothetical protein